MGNLGLGIVAKLVGFKTHTITFHGRAFRRDILSNHLRHCYALVCNHRKLNCSAEGNQDLEDAGVTGF